MIIKFEYPPNYSAVAAVFKLDNYHPIFAFGDTIYNPHRVSIGPELISHESVHGKRQGDDPSSWWDKYLHDENFRLAEEILAHIAEYTYLAERAKGRQQRRVIFRMIAARLRSPLYGYNPSLSEERAKSLLKWAMKQQS